MAEDTKAKDLVREARVRDAPARSRIGERTLARLEARRRLGPGGERRRRIFDRLGVADPYDADAQPVEVALGPVALKLGERRKPAPHARPPQPPRKKDSRKLAPKGVSQAPRPKPRPKATPPRTPPAPAASAPTPEQTPDTEATPEMPPRPPLPRSKGRSEAGRFRLRATPSSGPKVRTVRQDTAGEPESAEAPAPPPPRRSPPGPDKGLDDLFGFAQQEGRLRLRPDEDEG